MRCNKSVKLFFYFVIFMIVVFINQQLKNKLNDFQLLSYTISISILLIVILNLICPEKNEYFIQNMNQNPLNKYSMGPFSDLVLRPEESNWRHSPSNLPLYKPSSLYTPQGTPLPLIQDKKLKEIPYNSNGPTVDGTNKTSKNMFMFAYNQCRPECCPSTFSCDRGCVCTTEQQRQFINSRGINKK